MMLPVIEIVPPPLVMVDDMPDSVGLPPLTVKLIAPGVVVGMRRSASAVGRVVGPAPAMMLPCVITMVEPVRMRVDDRDVVASDRFTGDGSDCTAVPSCFTRHQPFWFGVSAKPVRSSSVIVGDCPVAS